MSVERVDFIGGYISRHSSRVKNIIIPRIGKTSQYQAAAIGSPSIKNIARIVNAVQFHSLLSGNKDCHGFRLSIFRIVISVSNVPSPRIVQKPENLPKI